MNIGKGGLPTKLLDVYRAFCPHQKLDAGGNDFAQLVAAKNGMGFAEGEKATCYMIGRSERTAIKGIVVTVANEAGPPSN